MNGLPDKRNDLDLNKRALLVMLAGIFAICAAIAGVNFLWESAFSPFLSFGEPLLDESQLRTQFAVEITQTAQSQATDVTSITNEPTQGVFITETLTPQPVPQMVPSPGSPQRFLSEIGIPNGTSLTVTVDVGTIHVITSGPVCVDDMCLSGGERRGSVVILLPRAVPYTLTNLVPTQNWHGAYYAIEEQWQILAEVTIAGMQMPGNCTGGFPCTVIDVLVIGSEGIVAQYTEQSQ